MNSSLNSKVIRIVIPICAVFLFVLVESADTAMSRMETKIIAAARIANKNETTASTELFIKSEGRIVPASLADPIGAISLAILIDAGPSQTRVLSGEKDIAAAVVRGLSARPAKFVIGKVGLQGNLFPSTSDPTVALQTIQAISAEEGKRADVPIYDLAAAAVRWMASDPGIHVLVFLGGGKDLGSTLTYLELRNLAEANHVACFVLLMADRSHRGPRAMLSHGWWMRELAGETAGIFLENKKASQASAKVLDAVDALRLVTYQMDYAKPGRHRINVKASSPLHLRVQKAVFAEAPN